MERSKSLQPNHSGYVTIIGVFDTDKTARAAEQKLVDTVKKWIEADDEDMDWNEEETEISTDGDVVVFRVYTGCG